MSAFKRQEFFNTPNLMTYGRIALVPIMVIPMAMQFPGESAPYHRVLCYITATLFILAGISDLVDGYYARRYSMVSQAGKLLDPMADKLLHATVMIMLIPLGTLPAWLVVFLICREIFISGIRSVAAAEGMVMAAEQLGKYKTAWLNVGLSSLLIHYPVFGVSSYTVGIVSMGVGAFFSLASALQYMMMFYEQLVEKNDNAQN